VALNKLQRAPARQGPQLQRTLAAFAKLTLPEGRPSSTWTAATEDEVTLRRKHRRVSRTSASVLGWASGWRSPSCRRPCFGQQISFPVLTAPCGGMKLIHPEADIGIAPRPLRRPGTMHVRELGFGVLPWRRSRRASPEPHWFPAVSLHGSSRDGETWSTGPRPPVTRAIVATVDTQVRVQAREGLAQRIQLLDARQTVANMRSKLGPQLAPAARSGSLVT